MAERVILCIGTKKGLFVAEGSTTRRRFELRGPFGPGVAVYSALIDVRRSKPRVFASSCCPFFGMKVLRSTDLGHKFKATKASPAFPKTDGRALANIWSLETGNDNKDLWCGVEPASLFRSGDLGDSWEMMPGISNHQHAQHWQPGQGGLCMHTIMRTGNGSMWAFPLADIIKAMIAEKLFQQPMMGSAPDLYLIPTQNSDNASTRWQAIQRCRIESNMQNHGGWEDRPGIGVLRSDDQGQTWQSISDGLPSDFGFPIVVHPHDPDVVYVVPLEASTRTCPDAKPAVWRSENGGKKWQRLRSGLPKKESFFTVLRDAMDFDHCKKPALYFGTTTGTAMDWKRGRRRLANACLTRFLQSIA